TLPSLQGAGSAIFQDVFSSRNGLLPPRAAAPEFLVELKFFSRNRGSHPGDEPSPGQTPTRRYGSSNSERACDSGREFDDRAVGAGPRPFLPLSELKNSAGDKRTS